jgi:hypothetical protein
VAALAGKQTAFEVLFAQLAWLAWREGFRATGEHALRVLAGGAALGIALLISFEPAGLWLNLVQLPARLPWAADPLARLAEFAPQLFLHAALPAAFVVGLRRQIFHRDSLLLLPVLSWFAALPIGIASLLKTGGSSNSLHGVLYLLPPAMLSLVALPTRFDRRSIRSFIVVAAALLAVLHLTFSPRAWRPLIEHLQQADDLAAARPGEIWFPWNPLVTFYREGRFDHTEDGLYVRLAAGRALSPAQIRRHLPPQWQAIVLRPSGSDWGLARHLCPPDARPAALGPWTIYSWSAPPPAP